MKGGMDQNSSNGAYGDGGHTISWQKQCPRHRRRIKLKPNKNRNQIQDHKPKTTTIHNAETAAMRATGP